MANETGSERTNRFERFGRGGVFLSILCALPVFFIIFHFSSLGTARAAALCTAVNVAVATLRWDLKAKLWFWCEISLMFLVQAVVVWFLPLGDQSIPAYGLLPAAVVIYFFDEGVIFLLRNVFSPSPK